VGHREWGRVCSRIKLRFHVYVCEIWKSEGGPGTFFTPCILSSISIESGSERFVIENDFLIDILDHKLIRDFSKSPTIEIGMNIEILGSKCFSSCKSLSSITFESNSHLTRIESEAFSYSSLQSIVIPRNVRFIDSSAFTDLTLLSISIESGNEIFVIENDFVRDIVDHKLIRWRQRRKSGIPVAFRRFL
jgi:hypothetical protein